MSDESELIFVSHAGRDRQWAEWVAWHLEAAGYRVELGLWHWRAGDDFVKRMNEALERASAVVAVVSPHYFEPGRYTEEEWRAAVARRGRFVPVVVQQLERDAMPAVLASLIRVDLHELPDEDAAVKALTDAVRGPARPERAPVYPPAAAQGPHPRFPAAASASAVWEVRRRRNPHFTGRDDVIGDVRRKLLAERHAAVQALHGTGGIGKTQVALEYVYRFAAQYDIVWWIDAEQAEQIPVHFAELATRVGVARPDAGVEANARYALEFLRSRERWLIVLDNAEDPERLETLLPNGPGHVLLTSRNPAWGKIVPGLRLGVFSRAESLAHLTGQLPSLSDRQADDLAEALGDLPLALAQAVGVLSDGMPVEQYLRVLQTNTAQLLDHGKVHGYPASLAASIAIAQDRLRDGHQEAAALLRLASLLGPEPVPTGWLVAARPRLTTAPDDPDNFRWPQNALNPLARYGLAVVGPDAFQVHRLTQAVVREGAGVDDAGALWDDVAALLTSVDPGDPELPETWPEWSVLTPHLVSTLDALGNRAELRHTLLEAAKYLVRSAQPHAARKLAETLHRAWAATLGEDDPDTLHAAHRVTWAIDWLGAHAEALPLVQDLLERRRRVLGEDHPSTLDSANDLGVTLGQLGRYTEAHAVHLDVLERRRRALGEAHVDTLRATTELASALNALGRWKEAHRRLSSTVEAINSVLGEDHPEALGAKICMAATLHGLRRHAEAHRMNADVLKRAQLVYGAEHPETLSATYRVALSLMNLGRYKEAHEIVTDVLHRERAFLGPDHPSTLHSAEKLGLLLVQLDRHEEAHEVLSDTLNRRNRVLGVDHPLTLDSTDSLARALNFLGRHAEAEELVKGARSKARKLLGDKHPLVRAITDTLASALAAQGKLYEAQKLRSAASTRKGGKRRR
ncbi:FxSxx-COOH system tetratricopeptide repeat protein [Streptomyces sp. NPDC052610]|uniref:FxSxx-COOH system tetratricopeptide repeat protein n=1 Tax=Streptomyces sp. NPDC052610 TaxID=3154952 RepID=UPI0034328399